MDGWKGLRWLRILAGFSLGILCWLFALWAGLFWMTLTFLFFTVWGMVFFWWAVARDWRVVAAVIAVPLLCAPAASVMPEEFMQSQADVVRMMDEGGARDVPEPYLYAISWMHRTAGVAAWVVGFEELGRQVLTMHDDSGLYDRTFHSPFPLYSPVVRAKTRELIADADPTIGNQQLGEVKLEWDDPLSAADTMRVSLALDCPSRLGGSIWQRNAGRWARMHARCYVSYERHDVVGLGQLNGVEIAIHHGLFWLLQERGWLHPYEAVWRFEINDNDPLLVDGATVGSVGREQWFVSLLRWAGV